MKKPLEILGDLYNIAWIRGNNHSDNTIKEGVKREMKELRSAMDNLYEAMLEVIGEDEANTFSLSDSIDNTLGSYDAACYQDDLRREQRKKLAELFGREE